LTTVLSSAYLLWMYKRIFFGRIPQELGNVRDSNKYILVTMAALAGLSLIIGVYPEPLLAPITSYVQGMFHNSPGVVPLPSSGEAGPAAVPLAKSIMFKSGARMSGNVADDLLAFVTVTNSGIIRGR
jgi:hypothetical protein